MVTHGHCEGREDSHPHTSDTEGREDSEDGRPHASDTEGREDREGGHPHTSDTVRAGLQFIGGFVCPRRCVLKLEWLGCAIRRAEEDPIATLCS